MGPTGYPEMSENNYQHKMRTNLMKEYPMHITKSFNSKAVTEEMEGEHNTQQG